MRPGVLVVLSLLAAPLSGCIGATTAPDRPISGFDAGVHPWPKADGSEWPLDLAGPFAIRGALHHPIESFDGTTLDGHVYLPDVPAGTRVPVLLWSHPYFGQGYPSANSPEIMEGWFVPVRRLVAEGYAMALYSVRGSGHSGGCFEMFGPNEQKDQAVLVERLAGESWSNGRVGMIGLSYHGTTPWQAAIQNPPALKTIVVAGMVSDAYTFYHTPQGAPFTIGGSFQALFNTLVSFRPAMNRLTQPTIEENAAVAGDRACPEVVRTMTSLQAGAVTDARDADYWDARRLIDRFPEVTTSVLLTHGFQDQWGSGHQTQEAFAWGLLDRAPKRMLEGQWGHSFPDVNDVHPGWEVKTWNDDLVRWLDFWLKGIGAQPRLDIVDYQDSDGRWHASSSWPPAEARDEVLYLAGATLSPSPGAEGMTFRSAPDSAHSARAENGRAIPGPVCGPEGTRLIYESEPLARDALLAGNPHAWLRLTSDLPGGLVAVTLLDLSPDFGCVDGAPSGARALVQGVADLRFHGGWFDGRDFPTGTPTGLRIDIVNLAERIPAGHRLGVLVAHPDPVLRSSQPYAPTILVHADGGTEASHLVLPLVEGTFGGEPPTLQYPPRPFVPAATGT